MTTIFSLGIGFFLSKYFLTTYVSKKELAVKIRIFFVYKGYSVITVGQKRNTMAAVQSTMATLGTKAPSFKLPNVAGGNVELEKYARNSKGTIIMFICNHCPYVKYINTKLVDIANEYMPKGIAFIAINSNDVENYPEDSPEKMKVVAMKEIYPFPYLFDEDQEIAKKYEAACTPDFYLYDAELNLNYRGQFDASRPGNAKEVNGEDLKLAMDTLLKGKKPIETQVPSIGCNIKWKPGNEPHYFG